MSNIDQFESVFRSSLRDPFVYEEIKLQSVLVVTDMEKAAAENYGEQVEGFINKTLKREVIGKGDFSSTQELLDLVEQKAPDLICTYRNLHSNGWKFPHSLGEHLDVLIQKTPTPVLILPHPSSDAAQANRYASCQHVMAMTDHLAKDHRLINNALAFAKQEQTLSLVHIENDATFDKYIEAISKIQTVNTDDAEKGLKAQLLKDPADYLESCKQVIAALPAGPALKHVVKYGHLLEECKSIIETQSLSSHGA